MNAKSRLQSKTYWGVIVTAVVGLIGVFGVGDFTAEQQAALVSFLVTVCGAFAKLRDVTGAPIACTKTARKVVEDIAEKVQRESDERLAMAHQMRQGGG